MKLLLPKAARASHKSVSEFLFDVDITAAHEALADRHYFALSMRSGTNSSEPLTHPITHKFPLR